MMCPLRGLQYPVVPCPSVQPEYNLHAVAGSARSSGQTSDSPSVPDSGISCARNSAGPSALSSSLERHCGKLDPPQSGAPADHRHLQASGSSLTDRRLHQLQSREHGGTWQVADHRRIVIAKTTAAAYHCRGRATAVLLRASPGRRRTRSRPNELAATRWHLLPQIGRQSG